MTQSHARVVARRLNQAMTESSSKSDAKPVVAVSADTWHGRWSGTSREWGVVIDNQYYAEIDQLPEALRGVAAGDDSASQEN